MKVLICLAALLAVCGCNDQPDPPPAQAEDLAPTVNTSDELNAEMSESANMSVMIGTVQGVMGSPDAASAGDDGK